MIQYSATTAEPILFFSLIGAGISYAGWFILQKPKKFVRVSKLALFVAIFVVWYGLASFFVPHAIFATGSWHQINCSQMSATGCSISAWVLEFWWIVLLPAIAVVSAFTYACIIRLSNKQPVLVSNKSA